MLDLRTHLDELAADLGVPMSYDQDDVRGGSADFRYGSWVGVHCAPIECVKAYYTALHELGHVATSDISDGSPLMEGIRAKQLAAMLGKRCTAPALLEAEAEATLWALDHAAIPMDEDALDFMRYAICSYAQWCATAEDCPKYRELMYRLAD